MKKLVLLGVIAIFLITFVGTGTVMAIGPAEKATGDVYFGTTWGDVHLTFNAHEAIGNKDAKGWVDWNRSAPYANWWSGSVIKTNVIDTDAYFTVRVTNGAPAVVGCDITFHVYDGGEPGINFDTVEIIEVVHSGPGNTCAACGQTQGPWTINNGNLQVHSNFVLEDTVEVYANDPLPTYSNISLESGVQYELVAMGTAYAGGISTYDIEFDAKYSITHSNSGDTWTDTVTDYEPYGTTLLDLFVNGVSVDWGAYNTLHIYFWTLTGTDAEVGLCIYDIYYPNNTGFITVNIYRQS